MNLRKLTIHFQDVDDLFGDINEAMEKNTSFADVTDTLNFDSPRTYRSFMTSNKIDILVTISRLKPGSVYELAKYLGRRPQHVSADCRSLEEHGLIKMVETEGKRGEIRPKLIFDYDVIVVDDDSINTLPVSEKSEKVLRDAIAVS